MKTLPLPLQAYSIIYPSQFDSEAEFLFADTWLHLYPEIDLHTQHRFAYPKRHTFDFAHLPTKTAIEIQGGTWVSGMGHSSGTGIRRDIAKTQLAAGLGWVVIPLASDHVADHEKLAAIAQVIQQRSSFPVPV